MARKNKTEVPELRQPDQFISFWTRVGHAIAKQRKALLAGVVAALVVAAGIEGSRTLFSRQAAHRARDFGRIDAIAAAPLLTDGAPAPTEEFPPRFKAEKERKEAALKEAEAFLAKHGSSRLKDAALLLKAGYLMDLGRAGEALPVYQEIAPRIAPAYRFLAQEGLAYAYEETGNLDKALETYGTLAQTADAQGGFYRDRALFGKARLLEKKGSKKDAEAAYKEIVAKHPTSALRDEVNDRLAVLGEAPSK